MCEIIVMKFNELDQELLLHPSYYPHLAPSDYFSDCHFQDTGSAESSVARKMKYSINLPFWGCRAMLIKIIWKASKN